MVLSGNSHSNTFNPRKGMPNLLSSSKISISTYSFPSSPTPPPSQTDTPDESMMEENIENAESIIKKWDLNSSTYTKATSLLQHSTREAKEFLKSVRDLHQAMHFFVSKNATSDKLVLAQNRMQIAMKRLEKEFYLILSANMNHLDPESVSSPSSGGSSNTDDKEKVGSEEELENVKDSVTDAKRVSSLAMSGLKSIADCMISCGYGKKCFKLYKILRKSIVEGAINLFRFPELITKSKPSQEKIYRLMEQYEEISCLWPEIESVFSFESTSAIKLQAHSSLLKLGEYIHATLSDFEAAIQKNMSKSPALGGGIHPLTRSAMNYISSLAEYDGTLSTIIAHYPLPRKSPPPEPYYENPNPTDVSASAVSVYLAWLILVLLYKLDKKAEVYKNVALSYLCLVIPLPCNPTKTTSR